MDTDTIVQRLEPAVGEPGGIAGFDINAPIHSGFPQCDPLPDAGQSTSHSFPSFFEGDVSAGLVGGEPDELVHVVGFGDTSVTVTQVGMDGAMDFFDTEMFQLDVGTEIPQAPLYEGVLLPSNILIRQALNRPSLGQIRLNHSTSQMDSFFDVFTEISLDFGDTWIPSIDATRMEASLQFDQPGDFNNDGQWDCVDINALSAAIAAGSTDLSFDMNGDGSVTLDDITEAGDGWLAVGGAQNPDVTSGGNPFLNADSNLDGSVDGGDFLTWNTNKFTGNDAWCSGDFDANGFVDGSDFLTWNTLKFQSSDAVQAVPEPASGVLVLASLLVAGLIRRR